MEVHSSVVAKRLWNVMRVTFFMIRKGLISKRKMIMDTNLMMKKGNVRKSLSNLMSSHHHHHHHHQQKNPKSVTRGGLGVHYEFSCSNSPNPVFFHMPKRKHHFNFPCIHAPDVVDDEHRFSFEVETDVPKGVVTLPKTPDYMFNIFVPGEKKSPLLSPFSVRVSNYSALDESEETGNDHVDVQAEDFIRRFYEQLRSQSPVQFLGY
ncbi:hypothetical protein LR48_Vigan03g186500 [Vigna angularis]|uniref:Uncharacterized protein n=2 Tax=Phaseolus angularis TaxID=3914 RepID=A0A0L9U6R3_PHAAN|nr:uncharacterized protein LOC108328698 [Vigna angularis]KOM38483.1 hypothetical protein LR48_Vigan03g186500 [Vigna angularis]BAT84872.1 hypothetical protein VIGAN_04233900 [Vigna angularis var. angularis]